MSETKSRQSKHMEQPAACSRVSPHAPRTRSQVLRVDSGGSDAYLLGGY